jgi:hypothetical protein
MEGTYGTYGKEGNSAHGILMGKPDGKLTLGNLDVEGGSR